MRCICSSFTIFIQIQIADLPIRPLMRVAGRCVKVRESSMAFLFARKGWGYRARRAVGLALYIMLALSTGLAAAADLTVALDEARLLRLPDTVATIVIGNPMIADVSLQPGSLLVITGKGFGLTNLVVLDRSGTVLMEKSIEVKGPRGELVVLYRGIERETYSCTPMCERRLTLGDSNVYFDALIGQAGSRNGYAQGAAPAAK
jgi:hypothetical protein